MMLKSMLDHIGQLDEQVARLGGEIDLRMHDVADLVDAIDGITGVGKESAQGFLSEMGTDMSVFPSAKHAVSWGGLAPGSNESAGKKKGAKTKKGNVTLRKRALQCARAASRSKDTYLRSMFDRIAARRGAKVAYVAVARAIVEIVYYMVRDGTTYEELGADYFLRQNRQDIMKRSKKKIESLGFKVMVEDVEEAPAA
jgi:transposase